MPVVPVMTAIGTAMGASAGTAAAVGAMTTVTAASVAATGYGMYQQNKAAKAGQRLAVGTAEYNAAVDEAQAKQVELDTTENLRAAREEAAIYTSRQRAAYASSGVLATGSPLQVMATTAGRMEQRIQQLKTDAEQEQKKLRTQAAFTRTYGQAQSKAIGIENTANMFRGGVGILSTIAGAYQGGMFSGVGKKTGFAY